MRGVGSLPPPGLEDAELSGDLEHPLQQALLRATGQKTVSKLAEDTKVKARVGQLEAKKVLPIDPGPDRLSGLSIAQALAELHQRDQGQPPGWAGRLALLGIEVGEVAILEDRPERVAQGEIGAAFGKAARAMRAVCSGTGGRGCCRWSDMAEPPEITAPTLLSDLSLTHSPTVSDHYWCPLGNMGLPTLFQRYGSGAHQYLAMPVRVCHPQHSRLRQTYAMAQQQGLFPPNG